VIPPQVLVAGHDTTAADAARLATETIGWSPVVIPPHDVLREAVAVVLPAYVLLDVEHPAATDPALYAVVSHVRARVVLYGTRMSMLHLRRLAVRFGVGTIDVPYESPGFSGAVEHRLDAEEWLSGWLCTRRTPPHVIMPSIDSDTLSS